MFDYYSGWALRWRLGWGGALGRWSRDGDRMAGRCLTAAELVSWRWILNRRWIGGERCRCGRVSAAVASRAPPGGDEWKWTGR